MTDMTPEQLDEARAREAVRRHDPAALFDRYGIIDRDKVAMIAARLARENWTPTDPDLIEAREIAIRFALPAKLASRDAGVEGVEGHVTFKSVAGRAAVGAAEKTLRCYIESKHDLTIGYMACGVMQDGLTAFLAALSRTPGATTGYAQALDEPRPARMTGEMRWAKKPSEDDHG